MIANPDILYEQLKALPPERRAEVEDFMNFLTRKEARSAALDRLLAIAPALEAAGVSPMTEEEIQAEIHAARAASRARLPRWPVAQAPGQALGNHPAARS